MVRTPYQSGNPATGTPRKAKEAARKYVRTPWRKQVSATDITTKREKEDE